MRRYRFLVLALALTLLAAAIPGVIALSSAGADRGVLTRAGAAGGGEILFTREEFAQRTGGETPLEGIVLTALPPPEIGTLVCGARMMMAGEAIVADALDTLRFVPATLGAAETSFSYLPVFGGYAHGAPVTVRLTLAGLVNRPPTAEDMSLVTYRNIAVTQAFKGTDPDGDALFYKITKKARRGDVEMGEEGLFTYTPYRNKTGADTFSYVAVDAQGHSSEEAVVSIKIEKPKTKTTYADMEGHPAYFAAVRLCEEGVFVGQQMGDLHYFGPDLPVSRGEFITLAMTAIGSQTVTPVAVTGFSDDEGTPAWVKPYASAALKDGMIHGVGLPDGRKALRADRPITRAEAAVILDNALRPADAGQPVFADRDAAPAWARQAAANMNAAGVLSAFRDGTMRLSETLSRAAAAEMLWQAMEVKKAQEAPQGLLRRVFG
ncbi:MAG: S-layer homology domain-containing protein [Oscillospiraceae bacterium]|nr:S-layer homology domain-containing protein [Oscillospiraceae bacterium]